MGWPVDQAGMRFGLPLPPVTSHRRLPLRLRGMTRPTHTHQILDVIRTATMSRHDVIDLDGVAGAARPPQLTFVVVAVEDLGA